MAEETTPQPEATTAPATTDEKPTAAKKEKAPAIEDKPFAEFIEQHYLPALKKALAGQGVADLELNFGQEGLPLAQTTDSCWQVNGTWLKGNRQFSLYFLDENITGQKAFSCAANGAKYSTIESFMIDEKKVTLDLLLLYTLQRLNGQKWLTRN